MTGCTLWVEVELHWAEGYHSSEGAVQPVLSFAEEADSLPPMHTDLGARKGWLVGKMTAAHRDFQLVPASELVGWQGRKAWIEAGTHRQQEAASGEILWRPAS